MEWNDVACHRQPEGGRGSAEQTDWSRPLPRLGWPWLIHRFVVISLAASASSKPSTWTFSPFATVR
jgi:hypothetical protein